MSTSLSANASVLNAPAPEAAFEVRWDERSQLFRVWDSDADGWAHRPGFSDERVARAVAQSLAAPHPKAEGKAAKRA